VPKSTLINRLNGTNPRRELLSNGRTLSDPDKEEWIIDMYERGLGPGIPKIQYLAQLLLSARLKPQPKLASISEKWVQRFMQRHNLKSKWTTRYYYQRAKCEDPQMMREWFDLVRNTIK
jgi:hypothetical protein